MHARIRIGLVLMTCLTIFGIKATNASEEIAEEQDLACDVCHVDPEADQLTDRGRYFEYLRTLEGYEAVIERFGRCIFCHVQEAGSEEFTQEGMRFRWMMDNMQGLKTWLDENHPHPTEEEEPDPPAT